MQGTPTWLGAKAAEVAAKVIAQQPAVKLIDGEQLKLCTTRLTQSRCDYMAELLNKLCPQYGIVTKDVLHEFLANVIQESGEFEHKVENMNYQAKTIVKTWPGRFYLGIPVKGKLNAEEYARQPKKLAIAAYGTRMGNRPGTEDGWTLRGSGFIGLTGYYVIEQYRQYKKFSTVEEAAAFCRGSDYGALDSALWFFCVLKDLMDEAERDEMIGIVKEINGGTIGLKDRLFYYKRVLKYVI